MDYKTEMTKMQHSRSECIKQAYEAIYNATTTLLSSMEDPDMRVVYLRDEFPENDEGFTLHEVVSPLFYLVLSCSLCGEYSIHYGVEERPDLDEYHYIMSAFVRNIYKFTMNEVTSVNIEDVVQTDWMMKDCSALFEAVERGSRQHTRKLIEFKAIDRNAKDLMADA